MVWSRTPDGVLEYVNSRYLSSLFQHTILRLLGFTKRIFPINRMADFVGLDLQQMKDLENSVGLSQVNFGGEGDNMVGAAAEERKLTLTHVLILCKYDRFLGSTLRNVRWLPMNGRSLWPQARYYT